MEFSEKTVEIFKALSDFQKEVKQPKKDADNPFFKSKYVPLENVVEVIHETASKHGLSEMTYPAQQDNAVGVGVVITHSSGQFIKFPPILLKPDKNTPQGIGAAITYARRYALSSAFGIASETDDDANSISGNNQQQKQQKQVLKATLEAKYETGKGTGDGFEEWYKSMKSEGKSNNDMDMILTKALMKKAEKNDDS